MTRYCRYCKTHKPKDEFDGHDVCRACGRRGHGSRSIHVALKGWATDDPRLPEMSLPTFEELEEGYEGETWSATKGDWGLKVRWRGDHAKFLCEATRLSNPGDPAESRTFDYPHEVVDWISVWATQLVRAR